MNDAPTRDRGAVERGDLAPHQRGEGELDDGDEGGERDDEDVVVLVVLEHDFQKMGSEKIAKREYGRRAGWFCVGRGMGIKGEGRFYTPGLVLQALMT